MSDPQSTIDAIDALVDEQLAGYESRSGYDHNVNQSQCRICGGDWHGLPIKRRMLDMRRKWQLVAILRHPSQSLVDELDQYRYDEDDSPIVCPGSDFIGPLMATEPVFYLSQVSVMDSGRQFLELIQTFAPAPNPCFMPEFDRLADDSAWHEVGTLERGAQESGAQVFMRAYDNGGISLPRSS